MLTRRLVARETLAPVSKRALTSVQRFPTVTFTIAVSIREEVESAPAWSVTEESAGGPDWAGAGDV